MNGSRENNEITAKEAGLKVRKMIENEEKKMAAGKISAAPVMGEEAKR